MLRFTIGTVATTTLGLLLQVLVERGQAAGQSAPAAMVSGMHVVFAINLFFAACALIAILIGWRASELTPSQATSSGKLAGE
jgi:hypothetical protein